MVVKNIFDKLFSLLLIILLLPFFIVISILIKLDTKGPIIFKQQRIGKNHKPFDIYKFRTMVKNAQNIGKGIEVDKNDHRITRVGKILRSTSLDELPQLLNILKGEMSIIGPRPTIKKQVDNYTDFQKKRLQMRPGVTGLAQVNGRNSIPWTKRIEYDVEYIENWSLLLDAKIMLKTVGVILKREGVYVEEDK